MSTWILLRGLTRESRHWGAFPAVLRGEMPDAEVVALDLPGNGSLNHLTSPMRIGEMTACCRAELARRHRPPPYHFIAMSLGAMVALDWATDHPQEIGGGVLINTSLGRFSPFFRRLRPGSYPTLLQIALSASPTRSEAALLRLTTQHPPCPVEVLKNWNDWHSEYPVSRRNALRQLLAAARYRGPASGPQAKLLILCSTNDRLVDVQCSQQLARHWQCHLAEHPSAGHDLALDDPAWVARQVKEWRSGWEIEGSGTA